MAGGSVSLFRNWIVTTGSPGMATSYSFYPQPNPFNNSPFLDGLDRILRAARRVPAACTEMRREHCLVRSYGKNEKSLKKGVYNSPHVHHTLLFYSVGDFAILAVLELNSNGLKFIPDLVRHRIVSVKASLLTKAN